MGIYPWDLQLLADGGGAGATGVSAGDAGQQSGVNTGDAALADRLAALGVPRDRIERRKKALERRGAGATAGQRSEPEQTAQKAPEEAATPTPQEAASTESTAAEGQAAPVTEVTRESLEADPKTKAILDAYANEIVQKRVRALSHEAELYRKMKPLQQLLGQYYGVGTEERDLDALSEKASADKLYFEDRAIREKRPVSEIQQQFLQASRQEQAQEQARRDHWLKLRQEGMRLEQTLPGFNFEREISNPVIARLTQPGVNVPLETAFQVAHLRDIVARTKETATQEAMETAARSVAAGQARPIENGTASQTATMPKPDVRDPKYRAALKQQIREAAARGEHLPLQGI